MAECYVAVAEGPILIAVDTPGQAQVALSFAGTLCRSLDRSVTLLNVSEPPLPVEEILRRLELTFGQLGSVVVRPLAGETASAILRHVSQQNASILLVGLPADQADLGGLTERLIGQAPCPVLLVPRHARPVRHHGTVLLPLDGTPSTASAVPWATEMAMQLDAAIEIVYVAVSPPPPEAGSLGIPSLVDAPQYEWHAWRREFLSRFCECYWGGRHPTNLRLTVQTGEPAKAILKAAEAADPELIVAGWHGDLSPERATVLRRILTGSRWPMLTVRVPAPAAVTP